MTHPVTKFVLDPFFETGTEGIVWSVMRVNDDGSIIPDAEGYASYADLHPLENGDRLRVFNADGSLKWEGVVDLERKRRHSPYPMNPQYGQQEVFGMWVHGFQRDLEPEDWARMFFDKLTAEYTPKKDTTP